MRESLLVVLVVLVSSCVDPDLGVAPYLCHGGEPRCPDGYACVPREGRDICLREGTVPPGDAALADAGGAPGSALPERGSVPPLALDARLPDRGAQSNPAIEGDWFTCPYSSLCGLLDNDGLRLRAGGLATALLGSGEFLEAGEPYCEVTGDTGTYLWDGQRLEVHMKSGTLKGRVDPQTGLYTVEWMSLPGGTNLIQQPVYMKRVPAKTAGACT